MNTEAYKDLGKEVDVNLYSASHDDDTKPALLYKLRDPLGGTLQSSPTVLHIFDSLATARSCRDWLLVAASC